MAKDETPKPKEPAKEAAKSPAKGKRILIVEDERPLAHALELKLGHEGYECKSILTGSEALKEALSGEYDLILLDLIIPEIDGFAILQQLQEKKAKTKVIVLSNLGQEEDKEKAKTLGASNYFVKSNTPIADIVKHVHDAL